MHNWHIIKQIFWFYNFLIRANQCSAFNCESINALLNSSTKVGPILLAGHPTAWMLI